MPPSAGPFNGGDGAIPVDWLKIVLERELADNLEVLGASSVDQVLVDYMQPDASGVVGFLQFWKGMEEILEACGSRRSRLNSGKQHAVDGFHFLRTCILSMGSADVSQNRSVFRVSEIRFFIERTIQIAGPDGEAYWRAQAAQLPSDDVLVTGEEVASALLAWLEQLVADGGEYADATYQGEGSGGSSEVSADDDNDSLDEGRSPGAALGQRQDHQQQQQFPQGRWGASHMAGGGPFSGALQGGRAGYDREEGALPPLPPSSPRGPPPRRNVLGAAQSFGSSGSGFTEPPPQTGVRQQGPPRRSVTEAWQRRLSPLEAGLTQFLQRMDKHPGSPTKEGAAEWRSAIELQVALTRQMKQLQASNEALTMEAFHRFASDHFAASQKRRPLRPGNSAAQTERLHWKATGAFCAIVQGLIRRRKAAGLGAFLALRRPASSPKGVGNEMTIFQELLKSQCETAMTLESRVQLAGRFGQLSSCVDQLQRRRLRSSLEVWNDGQSLGA